MAITVANSVVQTYTSSATASQILNVTGTNRVVVVIVFNESIKDPTSVTCGGNNMTKAIDYVPLWTYYYINPNTGDNTISVTSSINKSFIAFCLNGVAQSSPIGATGIGSTSVTLSMQSSSSIAVQGITGHTAYGWGDYEQQNSQTKISVTKGSSGNLGAYYKLSTGIGNMALDFNMYGSGYTTAAVEFFEAPSGPANLKSKNGLAKASIKSINGLALSSIKSINGLT